jgi:DNA-binding IclR family transcriptional regulator
MIFLDCAIILINNFRTEILWIAQGRIIMSEKKYIQSVQRAFGIIHFIADKGTAKLNEISEATGLKTSTAFGIIQTLEHLGQITRTNGGLDYTLGLNSLKLGLSYMNGSGISDKINELLNKLVERVDETASFSLKVGNRYYYLDYVLSSQPLKVVLEENKFIDFPDGAAVAKVFNNTDKNLKYFTDFEEVYQGTNCFAVPYKTGGTIVGCVALSGPSFRLTDEKMKETYTIYLEIMKELGLENHL